MGKFADRLRRHFAETPRDILDLEWEQMKHLNSIGPDVLAYAGRVKTFYGLLMNTISSTVNYKRDSFMAEDEYYLAA